MDIEGYEYKVLKDILTQILLINVELHPRNYDVKEFCQRIVDQGFSIECFIGDIPFGFYPLINIFGPKVIKYLKPWYTVAEKCISKKWIVWREMRYTHIHFSRGSDTND